MTNVVLAVGGRNGGVSRLGLASITQSMSPPLGHGLARRRNDLLLFHSCNLFARHFTGRELPAGLRRFFSCQYVMYLTMQRTGYVVEDMTLKWVAPPSQRGESQANETKYRKDQEIQQTPAMKPRSTPFPTGASLTLLVENIYSLRSLP